MIFKDVLHYLWCHIRWAFWFRPTIWLNRRWERFKTLRVRYKALTDSSVPKDEFHPSLEYNLEAAMSMTTWERKLYEHNLMKRRQAAHDADTADWFTPHK